MPNHALTSYRTWIDISKAALTKNYKTFRKLIGRNVELMGVIKSNAYGHGLMTMARAYESLGFDWLGVDPLAEALKLRQEGIAAKILVLGYTQPENMNAAVGNKISLAISTFENLRALKKIQGALSVHIKVDSGMHRQGFYPADVPEVIRIIKSMPQVSAEGVFTHFAAAKDPKDAKETNSQIALFNQAKAYFTDAGFKPIFHASATGGTINFPAAHYDLVRVGMGMYGYWPDPRTKEYFDSNISTAQLRPNFAKASSGKQGFVGQLSARIKIPELKYKAKVRDVRRFNLYPVLSWKTIIGELKWVEKGEKVGYDYTESLKRRTLLAVLPVGYWHGFWRAFSSKSCVLIEGHRCRVIGRVSMDMTVVDVTGLKNVRVGDEAVIIGKQGKEFISADELGGIAGTSCYEILTRLNPLIKKYYV